MPTLQWVRLFLIVQTGVNAFCAFFLWQQGAYDAYFQAWLISSDLEVVYGFGFVAICMVVALGIATATRRLTPQPKPAPQPSALVVNVPPEVVKRQVSEPGDMILVLPKESAFAKFVTENSAKYSVIDEQGQTVVPRLSPKSDKEKNGTS